MEQKLLLHPSLEDAKMQFKIAWSNGKCPLHVLKCRKDMTSLTRSLVNIYMLCFSFYLDP